MTKYNRVCHICTQVYISPGRIDGWDYSKHVCKECSANNARSDNKNIGMEFQAKMRAIVNRKRQEVTSNEKRQED